MAYAQLTYRESLRDIETCLRSHRPKLYHAGFRGRIARSTLADANRERDWRIYADFAQVLIGRARVLYATDDFGLALEQTAYALDSTNIELCLTLFPWAPFRRHKAAVKLHTMIDLRGNIPTFIHVSSEKRHHATILEELPIEAGAFYVMDRGYLDFGRLNRLHRQSAYLHHSCQAESERLADKVGGRSSRQDDRLAMRSDDLFAGAAGLEEIPRIACDAQP